MQRLPQQPFATRNHLSAHRSHKARKWRSGDNPAEWRGNLKPLLATPRKAVQHHPALAWREIGDFMAALRAEEGAAARALDLTILAAARTGETLGARWSEIDLENAVWSVPAERMKLRREHRVPLSGPALSLLRRMAEVRAEPDGYVFPGNRIGKPLSNMAMAMLLRRMGRGELTVHGFRSTFRDWTAETTGYPREVAEMALAHAQGGETERAYWRGDLFEKRRRLMEDWAEFCNRPAAEGNVVPLRGEAG